MKCAHCAPKHVWTPTVTVYEMNKIPYDFDATKLGQCSRILLQNLTVFSQKNSLHYIQSEGS